MPSVLFTHLFACLHCISYVHDTIRKAIYLSTVRSHESLNERMDVTHQLTDWRGRMNDE